MKYALQGLFINLILHFFVSSEIKPSLHKNAKTSTVKHITEYSYLNF